MRTESAPILQTALDYLHGGLSVLPILTDGSKAPALSAWDHLQTHRYTDAEATQTFSRNGVGIGVIGGQVSGNLAIVDIEFPDFASLWCELVESESPGLIGQLPQVLTPGKSGQPGKHFYFRGLYPASSGKLAQLTPEEALERTGDAKRTTAIEIKGEGGYCLAPGCPASCHDSGRLYVHVGGPFIEETPVLKNEEVGLLISCARALDHALPRKNECYVGRDRSAPDQDRPGDVFNRRGDWLDVLLPHGWVVVRERGGVLYLRRPGKDKGISATAGYCQSERAGSLLCVFSSNAAPLEIPDGKDHQCFSKFAAYALLQHNGDFREAAKTLAVQGYGFDVGLSAAELFASEQAADIENAEEESSWADLRQKVQRRSVEKSWDLSGEEIDAVVARAKKSRIENDPKLLARQAHQEIDESFGKADANDPKSWPRWKLIIIESDPPEYLLRAPYWDTHPKVVEKGGYVRATVRQLAVWTGLREIALGQADVRIPDKINGWSRILQRLLDRAEHRTAPPETRRSFAVLEFLWECLQRTRAISKNDDGSWRFGNGLPLRLEDGMIVFKLPWLLQCASEDAHAFAKREFVQAFQELDMQPRQFGSNTRRSRWWTLSSDKFEQLQNLILGGLPELQAAVDPPGSDPPKNLLPVR